MRNLRALAFACLFLLLGLALFGFRPAVAADIQLKAAPAPALVGRFDCSANAYCVGPYLGVRITGLNSNLDVLGSGLGGSFAAGGMAMGGYGGFQLWNGNYFAAAEAGCDYDMTGTGSFGSRLLCTEGIKLGMNLAGRFGIGQGLAARPAPSAAGPLSNISIPDSIMNSLTSPYVSTGAAQRFDKTGMYFGAGMQFLIASQMTVDADYKHITYNASLMANGTTPAVLDAEDRVTVGLAYHFK